MKSEIQREVKDQTMCRECEDCKRYLESKKIKFNCYHIDVKEGRGKQIGSRSLQTSPSWCPKRNTVEEPVVSQIESSGGELVEA